MAKVYCKECKYYRPVVCEPYNTDDKCCNPNNTTIIYDPIGEYTIYKDAKEVNKHNNCEYFEYGFFRGFIFKLLHL